MSSALKQGSRIFIAGHRGLVGSAVTRRLEREKCFDLVCRTRSELDLLDQAAVHRFFRDAKPDVVVLAAAKVGGIHANSAYQADFLYENLVIAANVIHAAAESEVNKLLFLGSSCIYPKLAPQPIQEASLLTGSLEATNEGYAIAKIAGLKLCEKYYLQYGKRFISAMPTNLYGPGDNYHPENSHVIPAMMRRFHEAKVQGLPEVRIWGTGKPRREFLHSDDLADAVYTLLDRYDSPETINIGTGVDQTISELAELMKEVTGFKGNISYDTTRPDGTPRKILDVSRIQNLGWTPRYTLREGLKQAYQWAIENNKF